ncbi:hypothetical protein FRB96_007670 [Tulasnella sp. 330]|nr:hypothetical protein FRB96_007670 [Tulasnella sp. 330]
MYGGDAMDTKATVDPYADPPAAVEVAGEARLPTNPANGTHNGDAKAVDPTEALDAIPLHLRITVADHPHHHEGLLMHPRPQLQRKSLASSGSVSVPLRDSWMKNLEDMARWTK